MATTKLCTYNVVAAFRDLEYATDALGVLREAGVDEECLSLLGRPVEEIEPHSEQATGEPIGDGVARHVAAGAAKGGLVGGALGAAGAAIVATIPGVGLVAGTGALIGAIAGGGAGSTVGSILEGQSAMATDHGWQQAIEAVKEGAVVVGVHSEDPEVVDHAEERLQALQPMSLHRVDDRGHDVAVS